MPAAEALTPAPILSSRSRLTSPVRRSGSPQRRLQILELENQPKRPKLPEPTQATIDQIAEKVETLASERAGSEEIQRQILAQLKTITESIETLRAEVKSLNNSSGNI